MRILKRAAIVAVAFAPLVMLGSPATAATAGAVAFEGNVTLPTFPCTPPATCTANFTASLAAGAGVSDGPAVSVVTGLSASVTYNEVCGPPPGQATAGTATGNATLTGTNVVGALLPTTVPFAWVRVGLVAVVTGAPVVTLSPLGATGNVDLSVVGAAVFVPGGGLPTCTGGSLTATVAGAAVLLPV